MLNVLGVRLDRGAHGFVVAGLIALAMAATPLAASAHFLGYPNHRWPWTQGHHELPIAYRSDCIGTWGSVADAAASGWTYAWNAARNDYAMPIVFYKVPANGDCRVGPDLDRINIFTAYVEAWWWGYTDNYERDCSWSGCWWDSWWDKNDTSENIRASVIRLNTYVNPNSPNSSFSRQTAFTKQALIAHELGHSLGLAHAGQYAGESSGCYSIMDYSDCSFNTPRPHDWNDVNRLYPGW